MRRFQTEAIAAAAIKSPHVGQVFDHGITDEKEPYIVMELLEGEDLRAHLRRHGPLAPAALAPILSQVAKALGLAHERHIVHRDIKPANVFLMKYGDEVFVKVLDFGIAKLADDGTAGGHTVTGNMMGTAPYMSPEQLVGGLPVDYQADLWALGIVAYKALTGRLPFNGPTLGAVSIAVNTGTFVLPSEARAGHGGLSPAIDAWVLRALARDPTARFASAREMADAFEKAAAEPVPKAAEREASVPIPPPVASDPHASASLVGPRSATGPTLAGTTHTEAVTMEAPPPYPQAQARAGGRRTPFAIAAVLLLAGTGAYAARVARGDRPDVAAAAPAPTPAPAATPARPSTMETPAAAAPAIDPNELPSVPSDAAKASGPSNTGRRRPPPAGHPGAAKTAEATARTPPPAAAPAAPPAPAAPEEPETVIVNGGCARCSKN